MRLEILDKKLKASITPKRYTHTLNVVEAGKKLAMCYHGDLEKVKVAALLHDCAKNYSEEELISYAKENNLEIDKITWLEPQLLHGPVGAVVAFKEYGIEDKQILNAIAYHTTGRKKMSKLEKIIYLADFIEIGRSYPGVEALREIAFENLDKAMIQAFSNTIRYITSIGGLIHPRTIVARNELIIKNLK